MLVLDTSAAVAALIDPECDPRLIAMLGEHELAVPHLLDTEFLHTLRRLVRAGVLSEHRATDALTDLAELKLLRYAHNTLSPRVWALRDNLTAYDATFVALAEALDVELVTCDLRLKRAAGHAAAVRVFSPQG